MRALLDTCTFIWLCSEPVKLSEVARAIIDDRSSEILASELRSHHLDPFDRLLVATAMFHEFPISFFQEKAAARFRVAAM